MVLCASYSGNTEETLACYEAAGALGADPRRRHDRRPAGRAGARDDGVPVIPLPGGLQPRAAVAYMLVVGARGGARSSGVAPGLRTEIDAAASRARATWRASWGPDADSDSLAKRVAQRDPQDVRVRLRGRADRAGREALEDPDQRERQGAGLLRASCPRPTTTRSCGWESAASLGSFMAVFLEDVDQHPRVRQRIELTAALIEPQAAGTLRLESQRRRTRSSALLSLVLLGDLVSVYLAVLRGIDPTPVESIERLKAELARERSRLSARVRPAFRVCPARRRAPLGRPLHALVTSRPGRSR